MKIAMLYLNQPAFGPDTHDKVGLGGSENGFIRTMQHLIRRGHEVHVFNQLVAPKTDYGGGLWWNYIDNFNPNEYFDVVYSLRHREPFRSKLNAKLKVLFLADTESVGLGEDVRAGRIDLVMAVSHWQKEKIAREEEIHDSHWMVTSNGVDTSYMPTVDKVPGQCLFIATPDRGLDTVLTIWPKIKEKVPHASLHLFSSFMGWGVSRQENDNLLADMYARADGMGLLSVYNIKHAPANTVRSYQLQSDLYLYPSDFYETCCMSVLESMLCGTVPIVTARAGLFEKVLPNVTGLVVPAYGTSSERYQSLFVEKTIELLQMPEVEKSRLRHNCQAFARRFSYDVLVEEWLAEWQKRMQ